MIYSFHDVIPVVHPSAYVHPSAVVIGKVNIGANSYIGPGAVLRGDFGEIVIHEGCNVQENCVIHMFPGLTVTLHPSAHVGHGAVIHGAILGRNCMIGMNAVIMDKVEVGEESIVGALSFVPSNMEIPPRSLVVGNPARIVKTISEKMIDWKTTGTKIYQSLPGQYANTLKECDPLKDPSLQKELPSVDYPTWPEKKA